MAHFYAEIQGNRGDAARCGNKISGIYGHIRGWNVGVETRGYAESKRSDANGVVFKTDSFSVDITRGSSGGGEAIYLGDAYETEDGVGFEPSPELVDLVLRKYAPSEAARIAEEDGVPV